MRDVLQSRLPSALEVAARGTVGPVWDFKASAAPAIVATDIWQSIDRIDLEQIERLAPELMHDDKLFLIGVRETVAAWNVSVRELDVRTRQWGPVFERVVPRDFQGVTQIVDLILTAFSPVGRVQHIDETGLNVRLRMRGGLLMDTNDALGAGKIGSLYRPLIRKNDRRGEPQPNGIAAIPWTVLEATAVKQGNVECRLHSGHARPLRAPRSRRLEQLAVLMHPASVVGELQLVTHQDPHRPLAGYRVYAKRDADASRPIGVTDDRGVIAIPPTESPLQILYVRSGSAVLARLPFVSGDTRRTVAPIFDNRTLLDAEGFLLGFQQRLVDLMARRTILAARIRQLIKDQKGAEARRLWDELRELPTADQLLRELDERSKQWSTDHKPMQQRLSKMFRSARQQVSEILGAELVDQLRRDLG